MRTQSKLTSRKRKRMKSAKSRPSKRANICLRRVASIIVIASMIFAGHKQVVSAAKLECRHQNQGANQARQAPARLDTMTSQPRPLEAPFVATSSASGLNEKTTAQATATTSALEPGKFEGRSRRLSEDHIHCAIALPMQNKLACAACYCYYFGLC